MEEKMKDILLETAVRTGDSGDYTTFIIIGAVCVVAVIVVAILGVISKKDK
jgi:hypothetical protein